MSQIEPIAPTQTFQCTSLAAAYELGKRLTQLDFLAGRACMSVMADRQKLAVGLANACNSARDMVHVNHRDAIETMVRARCQFFTNWISNLEWWAEEWNRFWEPNLSEDDHADLRNVIWQPVMELRQEIDAVIRNNVPDAIAAMSLGRQVEWLRCFLDLDRDANTVEQAANQRFRQQGFPFPPANVVDDLPWILRRLERWRELHSHYAADFVPLRPWWIATQQRLREFEVADIQSIVDRIDLDSLDAPTALTIYERANASIQKHFGTADAGRRATTAEPGYLGLILHEDGTLGRAGVQVQLKPQGRRLMRMFLDRGDEIITTGDLGRGWPQNTRGNSRGNRVINDAASRLSRAIESLGVKIESARGSGRRLAEVEKHADTGQSSPPKEQPPRKRKKPRPRKARPSRSLSQLRR